MFLAYGGGGGGFVYVSVSPAEVIHLNNDWKGFAFSGRFVSNLFEQISNHEGAKHLLDGLGELGKRRRTGWVPLEPA